ncbi:MAG TPA: DUF5996 family protein [Gemmatimonadota bacterium]|jgi:hypothetical protein
MPLDFPVPAPARSTPGDWPELRADAWRDTRDTLHMWTQVVGKVRLARAPHLNHWWQVPLYVTARGLTTSPMPDGGRTFQIDFDFLDHRLRIATSDGATRELELGPRSVGRFYREVMAALRTLGIDVRIYTLPQEVPDPIPFERDEVHGAYDAAAASRFWQVLVQGVRVLEEFRSEFLGKASPVHFFWGSFDLAYTRFSGRPAPEHPGAPGVADFVTREAYSHEVHSVGFWPGGPPGTEALFYAYAYPEPAGFSSARVAPDAAGWSTDLKEFVLPYESVRRAASPDDVVLEFGRSTYDAAATLGRWDRAALERGTGRPRTPGPGR